MKSFEELRESKDMKVKDWFTPNISYPFQPSYNWRYEFSIEKETEKAVMVMIEIESVDGEWEGVKSIWIPKSCFESVKDYEENQKLLEQRREERYAEGCAKYEKAIQFAKEHKVKGVRKGMRKDTILRLIQNAGFEYAY